MAPRPFGLPGQNKAVTPDNCAGVEEGHCYAIQARPMLLTYFYGVWNRYALENEVLLLNLLCKFCAYYFTTSYNRLVSKCRLDQLSILGTEYDSLFWSFSVSPSTLQDLSPGVVFARSLFNLCLLIICP